MATLQAAFAAAEALPPSVWLNLNASPALIVAGEPLRTLIARSRRRIVVEVTENTGIADYSAVEFAIDDAGTGFASLRHIVELRPAFVKLDRSLIAGIESDEARQAMIVGLCHFAQVTGCRLIVEGIETDRELTVLRGLAIELGQRYLLGRTPAGRGPLSASGTTDGVGASNRSTARRAGAFSCPRRTSGIPARLPRERWRTSAYRLTSSLMSGNGRSVMIRTKRPKTMPTTSANCPTLATFGMTRSIVRISSTVSGSRVTMWRWRLRHSNVATLPTAATPPTV